MIEGFFLGGGGVEIFDIGIFLGKQIFFWEALFK